MIADASFNMSAVGLASDICVIRIHGAVHAHWLDGRLGTRSIQRRRRSICTSRSERLAPCVVVGT